MLLHLYWWTVTQVYNEHWIVVNWKRSLYVCNLFQQVESRPKTPACLVTINLLVETQLGICRQAIPMVQQARDEGEVNTEEGRFGGGGGTSFLGSIKILLNCHYTTFTLTKHADVDSAIVEVGKGGDLARGHLLALVDLHRVKEVVHLHHAGLVPNHLLLLDHQPLELDPLSNDAG